MHCLKLIAACLLTSPTEGETKIQSFKKKIKTGLNTNNEYYSY